MMLKNIKHRHPSGYWREWKNFEFELRAVIGRQHRFPTAKDLAALGLSSLEYAFRYHGGVLKIRALMGYSLVKQKNGHWRKWPHVKNAIMKYVNDHDHFPNNSDLVKVGLSGLGHAIVNWHGGYPSVRQKMGYDLGRRPHGYWRKWSRVKSAILKYVGDYRRFPTKRDLCSAGLSCLAVAVHKYHINLSVVRAKMGYGVNKQPKGYWRDWGNVETAICNIVNKIGKFPTQDDLRANGLSSLGSVICLFHGSFAAVRARMGYTTVNAELLKLHAAALVRVFFALQKKMPGLKSDMLWMAIKKKWYAPDMERALKKAKRGNLKAFQQLLAS